MKIEIENKLIGENEPCFIIAEVGSNHNRNLKLAKNYIELAKKVGANAVKFQTFKADNLVSKKYAKQMYDIIKKYELKPEWHIELKEFADKLGIIFLSTPFDEESADLLEQVGVSAFKIASGDLTHLPLLEYVAKKQKPMILSTGGANITEIAGAISEIRNQENNNIILLQCVSNYPTLIQNANIKTMQKMEEIFLLPVGFSDHSLGNIIPLTAVALGASIIEKHITSCRYTVGSDHFFATEPAEFQKMIQDIRCLEKALGTEKKCLLKCEERESKMARRCLFARIDISEGTKITKDMIEALRPEIGMHPKYLNFVIGKKAKIDIVKDEIITWDMV